MISLINWAVLNQIIFYYSTSSLIGFVRWVTRYVRRTPTYPIVSIFQSFHDVKARWRSTDYIAVSNRNMDVELRYSRYLKYMWFASKWALSRLVRYTEEYSDETWTVTIVLSISVKSQWPDCVHVLAAMAFFSSHPCKLTSCSPCLFIYYTVKCNMIEATTSEARQCYSKTNLC